VASTIEALASSDAIVRTPVSALSIYAWRGSTTHLHLVYRPSLCVVVRGTKRARVGDRVYRYDPTRFFFTAVPLPAELDVKKERGSALVGMVVELDIELVARVALEIDDALARSPEAEASVDAATVLTGRLHPRLLDALARLLLVASDPLRRPILGESALREVVLELLVGPEGPALRRAVRRRDGLRPLIDVVHYLDEHSHEPIRISRLARRAAMSESAFFTKFRQATGATPLQYLKRLRLAKARVLLAMGTASVTEIAHSVGYASSAQFSRDFRIAFGATPSDVLRSDGG
jgi:AraC-like DNA-binding protein